MELHELERTWSVLAETDPLWAVCSDPRYKGGRWDEAEFLRTGEDEVARAMDHLGTLGVTPRNESCLEFGCGAGRCAAPLARRFDQYHGVDISQPMLDLARRRQPSPRAWFHHNRTDDLGLFEDESFDFVYTRLVLQHIPPEHALRYVDEFIRVLRPGGVAVFQAPGEVRWLDDSAFQAEIDLPGGDAAFGRLAPGRPYVCAVRVLNAGKVAWPKNTISLGNHWLGENGDLVQIDDGRTPVLRDLGPQQQAGLQLTVTSPPTVGRYVLEFDMVQECVTWFAHRGSRTLRIPVVVREPAAVRITNRAVRALTAARMWPTSRAAVVPATPETSYEVHVIPIGAVLKVIEARGVDLVEVADDDSCGGGLVSCRYTISKARSPDRAWPETPSVHET